MSHQIDMFKGEETHTEPKSKKDEYTEYIASKKWKALRLQALARAGNKCEVCGFSKWSVQLEVHHKTYERFKNERLDDLLVVCSNCHKEQDKIREDATKVRNRQKLLSAQFEGWARKVYGWEQGDYDGDRIYDEFIEWLETKEGD
jgi:predicted HNH restriction endonuclease